MKLKFTKKDTTVNVEFIEEDNSTYEFSYIEMVKRLFEDRIAEKPEIEGDFSEEERNSIMSLISDINEKCLVPENEDNIQSDDESNSVKVLPSSSEQYDDIGEIEDGSSLPFDL
jgi:hypothetical protein